MSEQHEWKSGAHQARFEPPNILWIKIQGAMTFEDYKWVVDLCRELGRQGALFVVGDMKELTTADPEGLRYVSEHLAREWFAGVIYVGARLLHKAMAKGIDLVQRMLGNEVAPVYFASTEEEARDLLIQLRRSKEPIHFQ